jgi:hypothetical protein
MMDCGAVLHTHIMTSSKQDAIFGDQRSPNLDQSYLSTGSFLQITGVPGVFTGTPPSSKPILASSTAMAKASWSFIIDKGDCGDGFFQGERNAM